MDIHSKSGKCSTPAGVVQMDVREEQVFDLVGRRAVSLKLSGQCVVTQSWAALDQDVRTWRLHQEGCGGFGQVSESKVKCANHHGFRLEPTRAPEYYLETTGER